MKALALAVFLAASACYGQQAAPLAQTGEQPPAKSEAGASVSTITVPAGTQIALTLASPITTKARKGDTVRAAVAFPVTVGNEVAIPVGTYVQGVITGTTKHSRSRPRVTMRFSSIVYPSGYTTPLDGTNLQPGTASGPASSNPSSIFSATAPGSGQGKYALAARAAGPTMPTLSPPPASGPPKGFIIGIVASTVAMAALLAITLAHRGQASSNAVMFDTGWQFDMVLSKPLSVDIARATAAS